MGGLSGLSGILESLEGDEATADQAAALFDEWLISCPEQGSRTVRTEECLLMAMSQLMPFMRAVGKS